MAASSAAALSTVLCCCHSFTLFYIASDAFNYLSTNFVKGEPSEIGGGINTGESEFDGCGLRENRNERAAAEGAES